VYGASAPSKVNRVSSDLTILQVLRLRAPAPVPAALLAEELGLLPEHVGIRMKSLVSLGYVECVPGAKDDAYALGAAFGADPVGVAPDTDDESPQDVARANGTIGPTQIAV
jgi:hypothetical protein